MKPNAPVFPQDMNQGFAMGLTKREYAAIAIMAGFAANSSPETLISLDKQAEWAVEGADKLIQQLSK